MQNAMKEVLETEGSAISFKEPKQLNGECAAAPEVLLSMQTVSPMLNFVKEVRSWSQRKRRFNVLLQGQEQEKNLKPEQKAVVMSLENCFSDKALQLGRWQKTLFRHVLEPALGVLNNLMDPAKATEKEVNLRTFGQCLARWWLVVVVGRSDLLGMHLSARCHGFSPPATLVGP